MKNCTDITQSNKLAKILPLKSADMDYIPIINIDGEYSVEVNEWDNEHIIDEGWIPCWSLAALLGVLPNNENISTNLSKGGYRISTLEYTNSWFVEYEDETNGLNNGVVLKSADNPVDACVAMIEKLNELKML